MSAYEQLLHPTVQGVTRERMSAWRQVARWSFAPILLVPKLWSCWHRRMSRPFTHDGQTYRVCLRCGVQRHFDLEQWKTKGNYYRDKEVRHPITSEGGAIQRRRNLRLIA
ncbi:MAG TPA: hypothetical protein VL907_10190 [Pyrinomonadaceae bacterium]|jgi:hypothetical protein|nr:hypothetical protein [Pyrinomonadaceae bacterium]